MEAEVEDRGLGCVRLSHARFEVKMKVKGYAS